MPRLRLPFFALALLLTAAPADAQPPSDSNPSFAAAVHAPSPPLEPAHDPSDPVARGFLGPLAGIGLIGASTLLGTVIGTGLTGPCRPTDFCLNALAVAISASIGAGVGLALFYPLGVGLGADALGGRGNIGWAYLGGLIGTAIGVGLFGAGLLVLEATGAQWGHVMVPAIILGAGAALVGPVIAYEMSHHDARSSRAPELTWMPTLNVDRHGATAGLVGIF